LKESWNDIQQTLFINLLFLNMPSPVLSFAPVMLKLSTTKICKPISVPDDCWQSQEKQGASQERWHDLTANFFYFFLLCIFFVLVTLLIVILRMISVWLWIWMVTRQCLCIYVCKAKRFCVAFASFVFTTPHHHHHSLLNNCISLFMWACVFCTVEWPMLLLLLPDIQCEDWKFILSMFSLIFILRE